MRDLSTIWKINGTGIFTPDDFQINFGSLKNEVTTDDGITHTEWIRSILRIVNITYRLLEADEMSYLLGLLQGKEFTLSYPDPITNSTQTITCKSTDNSAILYNAVYNRMWRDVAIVCEER